MFENEVHNLMALDHPYIVKLLEYFVEEKDVFLIFEMCEGPDLFDKYSYLTNLTEQVSESSLAAGEIPRRRSTRPRKWILWLK